MVRSEEFKRQVNDLFKQAIGQLEDVKNVIVRSTNRFEADVLRLIAKGYRAPEVAQLLGLTASTVSSYVRDIYRKLGISSRAEAATEAVRRGLVL